MRGLLALLLAVTATVSPLTVTVERSGAALALTVALGSGLPRELDEALPSGAAVRVAYPIRVRSPRGLWWDKRLWRGELAATAVFDPLTGRYRCEQLLDGVILASRETTSVEVARAWLTSPPPVRLAIPRGRDLRVRVRAVFASSTAWLLFSDRDATPWVEARLPEGS